MAIREYSMKRDANNYVTPHFKIKEFACADGSDKVLIDDDLLNLLENIRNHYNRPLHVNSGYRTPAYNATLKGASKNRKERDGRKRE